jgi:hypothetical protein
VLAKTAQAFLRGFELTALQAAMPASLFMSRQAEEVT